MIPYGRQTISEEDIQAVTAVLHSDFLTQGPMVPAFEDGVTRYCQAQHGVAMNSATSALHVACLALGVGPEDIVWTTPITFVASANCARYCGAAVDFVDIDPRTYNMSADRLAEKLAYAQSAKALPKVVIPVHLCGQPCDMERIHALSLQYGFRIIEDASHAIGGRYRGEPIGNCRYSDITIFSFHPVKIITTGEGGMAVTNDVDLAHRMRQLRSHGITREPDHMTRTPDGPWYYQQLDLGFNYRMTDIHAALGMSQLRRIDDFVARRHVIAARYDELLTDLPVVTPWQHPDSYSGCHLYVIRIPATQTSVTRRQVFDSMQNDGVGVNVHYIPVYSQPYYQQLGVSSEDFPAADRYYEEALSLPMYPGLTEADQNHVVTALRKALTI